MLNNLLEQVLTHYSGQELDYPQEAPDIIVILSYGTLPQRLTAATRENTIKGANIWRLYPNALIVFGNAEYLFHRAAYTECRYKETILQQLGVPESRILDVGAINNSIQEPLATRDALQKRHITAEKICLVTGRIHKPSAYLIWKYFFPEADIAVATIPHGYEYQPDHPVLVQRGAWRWLAANMARHYGFLASVYCEKHLRFIPFTPARLAQLHHRASID